MQPCFETLMELSQTLTGLESSEGLAETRAPASKVDNRLLLGEASVRSPCEPIHRLCECLHCHMAGVPHREQSKTPRKHQQISYDLASEITITSVVFYQSYESDLTHYGRI